MTNLHIVTADDMLEPATVDVTVGEYTFTLAKATRRTDKARRALFGKGDRYVRFTPFPTALDQMVALNSIQPFYFDILGCTVAINGNVKHPMLLKWFDSPAAWDEWVSDDDEEGTKEAELVDAVLAAQKLNDHWYPKATITAETEPESQTLVNNTIAALDPESTSDAEQASTAEITAAVEKILETLEEAQKEAPDKDDFLDQSK